LEGIFSDVTREVSLYAPIGKKGDKKFTLESVLESPTNEDTEERDNGNNGLYKKIVDFLMGEYFSQRNENLQLKKKERELKTERLRLRKEWLKFKRDRYESWKKLMEEKGRQKEIGLRSEFNFKGKNSNLERSSFPSRREYGQKPFLSEISG